MFHRDGIGPVPTPQLTRDAPLIQTPTPSCPFARCRCLPECLTAPALLPLPL